MSVTRFSAETTEDGWDVFVDVEDDTDGLPVVSSLVIKPHRDVPQGGLTATRLRRFNLGEIADKAMRHRRESAGDIAWDRIATTWQRAVMEEEATRNRSDRYYAAVGAGFLYYIAVGEQAPMRALARALEVPQTTAIERVREARARDLLTKPSRGRTGGELTTKALQLLGLEKQR